MIFARPYVELCKIRVSLLAAASSVCGFMLSSQWPDRGLLYTAAGVFILSCGACALNQYQERDIDLLMPRTQGRPLPSGRLRPIAALSLSLIFLVAGFFMLLAGAGTTAAGLGIFAVLWYNGVYTPLKRKSAFASIPGALTGALPPLLGWSAGGGSLGDPGAGALAICFVVWQIPHFWLLLLHYGGEYEKAGLPSLTRIWSRRQLVRLTFIWTLCAAVISLLLPFYRAVIYPFAAVVLALAAVWLGLSCTALLRSRESEQAVTSAFGRLNAYLLLVMLLLSLDRATGMLLGAV